jgi:hypothetical protein
MGWRQPVGFVAVTLALAACGPMANTQSTRHESLPPSSTTTSPHGSTSKVNLAGGPSSSSGGSSRPLTTTSPKPSSSVVSAPQPATPGTYTYDQSGSFSALGYTQQYPPQGTEVADSASAQAAGTWSQLWHSYLDTRQPPSDTTFLINATGIAITSEVIRMAAGGQSITFTCSFASPVEVADWPPTVGHQFSGSGNCTSPNNSYGSFTATLNGSINGTQQTSIGGAPTTAYTTSTTVTTSGSVTSTDTETDWLDPGLDLDLYQSSKESGSLRRRAVQLDHHTHTHVNSPQLTPTKGSRQWLGTDRSFSSSSILPVDTKAEPEPSQP